MNVEPYIKGDVIGTKYEVRGTLGRGGFGVVYLVFNRDTQEACALKTFRHELLSDSASRKAFKKEVLFWVNLESHPFILTARWVDEVSGRLFVSMDNVAPDAQGRVSLADHLSQSAGPLDTNQAVKWAIQFCLGMEHARAHGVECHRDVKPANILIGQDGTLKISDFGLATATEEAWSRMKIRSDLMVQDRENGGSAFSLMRAEGKVRCGTPGYMAPEVYRCEGADTRSDIYSFGLVLWQMAAGRRAPPFLVPWRGDMEDYLRGIHEHQVSGIFPRVNEPLEAIIKRCLRPKPAERYASFQELRAALESVWMARTGRRFQIPQIGELTVGFWSKKGTALDVLGRHLEAIVCLDKALAIDPKAVGVWTTKGVALNAIGRHAEAIVCYDRALAIDPQAAGAWCNKGTTQYILGQYEEAIVCFGKALSLDPGETNAWNNKGSALKALGRYQEAIGCHDKALAIDSRDTKAWNNIGTALRALGRHEEAVVCYDKLLAIDPLDANAWNNKGNLLSGIGRREQAIACYDKALAIDPQNAPAWYNKGVALHDVRQYQEAVGCYDKALAIDPRHAKAWHNKGDALGVLGRHGEAMACFEHAVSVYPKNKASRAALAQYQSSIGGSRF